MTHRGTLYIRRIGFFSPKKQSNIYKIMLSSFIIFYFKNGKLFLFIYFSFGKAGRTRIEKGLLFIAAVLFLSVIGLIVGLVLILNDQNDVVQGMYANVGKTWVIKLM